MSHLQLSERLQIETLLKAGYKGTRIAEQLGRNKGTISREIAKNLEAGSYCHHAAQKRADERRQQAKTCRLTEDNWTMVRTLLRQKWSPEQISGWLKAHPEIGFYVSDQWIYTYIYEDQANDGTLYQHLRRAGKPYKRGGRQVYRGKIKNRVDISCRPDVINKRLRLGDWEVDSVIGKMHQSSIVTIVERVSRYTAIIKVISKASHLVSQAIIDRMKGDHLLIDSMTGDNGTEFSDHQTISEALEADFYFTHPYSSWEKGTNENTNGLIRQYFPKGTDFGSISESMLNEVETALNHRPRKCLNYKTPHEVLKIGIN